MNFKIIMKRMFIVLTCLFCCVLFGCTKDKEKLLDAPTIKIDGNVVSWDKVAGAVGYQVKIGINVIDTEDTKYTININENGNYEISVRAYNSEKTYGKISNKLTYVVKNEKIELDAPFLVKDSNLVKWTVVTNATSYEVYVNDKLVKVVVENQYSFAETAVGTYKIKVKATSTDQKYLPSIFSNEVEFSIEGQITLKQLDAPVVKITDTTITWEKVEHADRYFIYVNGELVDTLEETTYTYNDAIYGDYVFTVKAVSDDNLHYIASENSNRVTYYKPIQSDDLDLSKPVCMFTLNWKYVPTFNDKMLMVKGQKLEAVSDYQGFSYQFIKEGNFYRIKLDNGMYLTHVKNGDSDLFIGAPKVNENTQLYHVTPTGTSGFTFTLAPLSNPGYLVCEDSINGYHQYMKMENDGVINSSQVWVLFNVNTTIDDDVIGEDQKPSADITKPVLMYTLSSSQLFTFSTNGLMVKGATYNAETDQTEFAVQLIAEGSYYRIKLADGYYLEYQKIDGVDRFVKTYKKVDDAQLFIFKTSGIYYTFAPVNNSGYLVCEDDYDGYHQYADCNADSQKWVLVNVEVEMADDKTETTEPTFDMTKPVLMYTVSSTKLFTFSAEGLMIKGTTYNAETDQTEFAVQLIAEGSYYRIKLADGYYLEYQKINGKDSFVKAYKKADNAQLFIFKTVGQYYTFEPVNNSGYLVCEDDYDGYHQYADCGVDSQRWVLVNVEVEIADDKIQ